MMTKDFGFLIIFDMFSYEDRRRNFPSHQGKAAVLCSPAFHRGASKFRRFRLDVAYKDDCARL